MNNTEACLQKLARFIVNIHKYYRDYYGMSIADIAHPRHRYLNVRVVETAFKLNNVLECKRSDHDIITYNNLYRALHYLNATDLIKVLIGKKPEYDRSIRSLISEYAMVPMYDIELVIKRLKNLILEYIEDDENDNIYKDFNSKGNGFKVVDNNDIFFKVLKQRRFENHPLRKQLESLTEEYKEPGIAIPIFADENDSSIVSGDVSRVYIIDGEPRVDLLPTDNDILTSLIENRTQKTCDHYILYPVFHKKNSSVADPNDDNEVINNINKLIGFRMMVNEAYVDTLDKLREEGGVYQPLYRSIPLKGNVVIGKVPSEQDQIADWSTIEKAETSLPHPFIVKAPKVSLENIKEVKTKMETYEVKQTLGLPVLLPLDVDLKGLNIKETKMKEATFELKDSFKMLEYLQNEDGTWKDHPVSKRIQDTIGEYARPIPVIRNLADMNDVLVTANNEPEGYAYNITRRENTYYVTVSAYPGTTLEEVIEKKQKGEETLFKIYPSYFADENIPDVIDDKSASIVRTLHCFDYREIKPAKVLKFKK